MRPLSVSPAPVVGKAMSGSRKLQANHIISISAAAHHHGGPQQSIECPLCNRVQASRPPVHTATACAIQRHALLHTSGRL